MAKVTIKYNDLMDASNYAKKLANNLNDYADNISRKVSKPLAGLPGNDGSGYASTASSFASKKINELRNNSSKFKVFSEEVERFRANAICADGRVAQSIKSTASSYVGERSAWQGFCDFLWNTVCVDFFNGTAAGRFIKNCTSYVWSGMTSVGERVRDWFKHGKGKYVWNIVSSVVATVGAVVGAITAVAAVVAGGTFVAIVIAVVAACAAIVGAIITTVNSAVKIYNNGKALASDDPGVSRYVGTIKGLSDAVEKYDMGDAEDNKSWNDVGKVVDTVEVVCDTIGIVKGVTDLGAVKSDITGRVTGYKFNKQNVLYNLQKSAGFDVNKNKYRFFNPINETKSWYANENGYGGFKWLMNRHTSTQNVINGIANSNEALNRTMKFIEKADNVYEATKKDYDFSSTYNTIESLKSMTSVGIDIYDGMGNVNAVFKGINKWTIKPYKNWEKIKEQYKINHQQEESTIEGALSGNFSASFGGGGGGGRF